MAVLSLEPTAKARVRPDRVIDPHLVVRAEPCACGAPVVQLAGEEIPTAVRRHQATPDHVLWRQGVEDYW